MIDPLDSHVRFQREVIAQMKAAAGHGELDTPVFTYEGRTYSVGSFFDHHARVLLVLREGEARYGPGFGL